MTTGDGRRFPEGLIQKQDLEDALIRRRRTQGFCQPALHSSIEQWGLHFAKSSVAVHWCWVTGLLYEEQIFIGVTAVTQGCCQPVLKSSTEQWGSAFCQKQCCSALELGHCTPV